MSSCGSCANVVPRTVGDPYQLSDEGSEIEMDQKADEIKRLQGCINDLISVLALPALWDDHEPSQVVSTLLDVLLGMLRLDFAYARLSEALDGSLVEVVSVAQRRYLAV